jgi:hypothetical protein
MAVDSGEASAMRHKASPILVPDGALDAGAVARMFEKQAEHLPGDISRFVLTAL